jgi:hypothetical protein
MEATRVSVDPRKIAYYEKGLTDEKRRKIEEDKIIEIIKSKPAGTRIRLREFGAVLNIERDGLVDWRIQQSIKRGTIGRNLIGAHRVGGYYYWVNSAATKKLNLKQYQPKKESKPKVNEAIIEAPMQPELPMIEKQSPTKVETPMPVLTSNDDIIAKAKDYAWQYNSDSLRDFIKWLGN